MSEQELQDHVLVAVRNARPAIEDAALAPTSADALKVLERVLRGEAPKASSRVAFRRRIFRPRIGAFATATAAVVAAALLVLSGISGGPSLVDRAYAAINAGYRVLHEVDIRAVSDSGTYDRIEGWVLPTDGRMREIDVSGSKRSRYVTINEWIITATGDAFTRGCITGCRSNDIRSFVQGRAGWSLSGRGFSGTSGGLVTPPGTFANWFKAAYHNHAIVEDGTATFYGRHVARLRSMTPTFESPSAMVFWRPGTPPPLAARKDRLGGTPYALIDWYVDPTTAVPVGFTASPCANQAVRSCARPIATTRIITFQRLDPTSQNLALLTGPHAPKGAR